MNQDMINHMVQGLISNKAKGMTRDRAMEDPKKAFGALSKLAQKMNPIPAVTTGVCQDLYFGSFRGRNGQVGVRFWYHIGSLWG